MGNTKGSTFIAGESIPLPENGSQSSILVAPALTTPLMTGEPPVRNAPNGEQSKWLSVVQNDISHYQKSGGKVLVKEQGGFLVVAFPGIVRCIECRDWMISGSGCQRCLAEYGLEVI